MIPRDEDSPTIKSAKTAINQVLENRYTESNLQDHLLRISFIDPRHVHTTVYDASESTANPIKHCQESHCVLFKFGTLHSMPLKCCRVHLFIVSNDY